MAPPPFQSLYCERTSALFWGEPLNAITNFAFWIAAFAIVVYLRRNKVRDVWLWLLVLNIFVIGIGSFLFHTMPSPLTGAADVIPIVIFVFASFAFVLRRGFKTSLFLTIALLATLLISVPIFKSFAGDNLRLSVSFVFLPVVFLLFTLSSLAPRMVFAAHYKITQKWLLIAASTFAVSLTARTIDMPFCFAWPYGMHFIWHILNAIVCYCVLLALVAIHR